MGVAVEKYGSVETRMGLGKESPVHWLAVVKLGLVLYNITKVAEYIAQRAIIIATSKMPIRTQFIISG
ncbi:50S ribosomal protein L16 chloroplastic [Bienertia sinuspersici]